MHKTHELILLGFIHIQGLDSNSSIHYGIKGSAPISKKNIKINKRIKVFNKKQLMIENLNFYNT
jgi:hypothetical protein